MIAPPAKRRRKAPEADLQRSVVALLSVVLPAGSIVHHSANEQLTKARQAILVGMGVYAGFADLIVLSVGQVVFLELKSKTGQQSAKQADFQRLVEAQGWTYAICRSVDDALDAVRAAGVKLRIVGNAKWLT